MVKDVTSESLKKSSQSAKIKSLYFTVTGEWLKIHSIPAGLIRAQFLRFGIHEGERVRCMERLPGGTVVIQKNRQQIAIGDLLAKQIFVLVVEKEKV